MRSSVMRLSTGTWPRRPWRSPFGIMTLENPTISLAVWFWASMPRVSA
ncbi:hypothetical protein MC885_006482 [Smutsia gigantea]|nr:hypothetical protein MC885_006482 [Smutsia gigantea]